jgi:hypothetical protein
VYRCSSALVHAFIEEVQREVRAGEFCDTTALVQVLSTRVQAALTKSTRRPRVARKDPVGLEIVATARLGTC